MAPTAWSPNYVLLKAFAKENGHCNVPSTSAQRYLAKWATRIKMNAKTNPASITEKQRKQLDEIGFDWSTQQEKEDQRWNDMYQRLVSFKAETGTCLVKMGDGDTELATWVTNQRKRAKMNKLRQDRKEILLKIGFSWQVYAHKTPKTKKVYLNHEKKWNDMFEKLMKYKIQYGDCDVPYHYPKDPPLGMWVSTQRVVYKKKTYLYGDQKDMDQSRKDSLDSIAFGFNLSDRRGILQETITACGDSSRHSDEARDEYHIVTRTQSNDNSLKYNSRSGSADGETNEEDYNDV